MRQRCQKRGKFREPLLRRKRTEFCHRFIVTHEYETFATIGYTIDVIYEVAG